MRLWLLNPLKSYFVCWFFILDLDTVPLFVYCMNWKFWKLSWLPFNDLYRCWFVIYVLSISRFVDNFFLSWLIDINLEIVSIFHRFTSLIKKFKGHWILWNYCFIWVVMNLWHCMMLKYSWPYDKTTLKNSFACWSAFLPNICGNFFLFLEKKIFLTTYPVFRNSQGYCKQKYF